MYPVAGEERQARGGAVQEVPVDRATCPDHEGICKATRKRELVYVRLPGKGNSHGARPVYSNHIGDYVDSDK